MKSRLHQHNDSDLIASSRHQPRLFAVEWFVLIIPSSPASHHVFPVLFAYAAAAMPCKSLHNNKNLCVEKLKWKWNRCLRTGTGREKSFHIFRVSCSSSPRRDNDIKNASTLCCGLGCLHVRYTYGAITMIISSWRRGRSGRISLLSCHN